MPAGREEYLKTLERIGRLAEDAFVAAFLLALAGLAGLQIFLRNVLGAGFVWADELLRILVLWLAMAGAVAASRDDNHISIDLLTRFLPGRVALALRVVADIFTSTVSGIIAWSGFNFIGLEKDFGSTALGNLPAWLFEIIIPVGFGLICYRYGVLAVINLRKFIQVFKDG